MKRLAILLLTSLIMLAPATHAFAWGDKGHRTVGQVAQLHLNPNTIARINQILRPGESLASVANWADSVKRKTISPTATHPDADTQHFLRQNRNRNNRNWHFVDLPLDCPNYNCQGFTSSTDIVHMINLCISKLQGGNVPQFTRRNALRMLVHLVGDLHQPLHVGVGFINVDGPGDTIQIVRDPAQIRLHDFPHDVGGNKLLITDATSNNLHSYWDGDLVEDVRNNRTIPAFATFLKGSVAQEPSWNGTGAVNKWAAQWATDSLRVSRANAYNTIAIENEVIIDDEPFYNVTRGADYGANNRPIVQTQLAKGGYRLAKLLEAIFP
ncbi:MAG TPA: S1/P1 nuclease [Pyrinomonadaceae bacterium]